MIGKVFVDTNVLVYPYDRSHPEKQVRALGVLERLVLNGQGVLSAQVLGEFFRVVTTKLLDPLSMEEAERQVQAYFQTWVVTDITPLIVLEAARGVREHRLNYWDAQLWATALLNQAPVVLSEDFADGRTIEGIRFLNPFSRQFQMAQLG